MLLEAAPGAFDDVVPGADLVVLPVDVPEVGLVAGGLVRVDPPVPGDEEFEPPVPVPAVGAGPEPPETFKLAFKQLVSVPPTGNGALC